MTRQTRRREVRIECRIDGLILYPQKKPVPVRADNQAYRAAQEIYRHVRGQLANWGSAGSLHRWQPVLTFYVRPDGLANYYRMRAALLAGGLPIEHRLIDWETLLELPDWQQWRMAEGTGEGLYQ